MNTGTKISESDPCKVFETFAQILKLEQFFFKSNRDFYKSSYELYSFKYELYHPSSV